MKVNVLKSIMMLNDVDVESLVAKLQEKGLSISKWSFYRRLKGISEFDRKEIASLKDILALTDEQVIDIFFNDDVA